MRYRVDPERLLWQEVDGEVVIVDLANSTYLAANATATVLWPLLATGATLDELVAAVTSRFDADEGSVRVDIEEFLNVLGRQQLLATDGNAAS